VPRPPPQYATPSGREQLIVNGVIERALTAATVGHDPNVTGRLRRAVELGQRRIRV
jgi:hypothetical protein